MTNAQVKEAIDQKRKDALDIHVVRKFYTIPTQKNLLGPRSIFDQSQYRIIFRDRQIVTGFLECKHINNGSEAILNIGLLPKYKYLGFLAPIFINMLEQPTFSRTKYIYMNIHVSDVNMEHVLTGLRFQRVVDKSSIHRLKFVIDGMHIAFKFNTGRK